MAKPNSVIPAPPYTEEEPFEIGDTLTVFAAAMVYAGRHPHLRFLRNGSFEDHIKFLRAGISERDPRRRIRARRSWDIYCELINRIKAGRLVPIKCAYLEDGEIDPRGTVIETADLVWLANDRGEQPKYLKHLLRTSGDRASKRPVTRNVAATFTAEYIATEKQTGRRPTIAGLERAAVKAGFRGGREFLRDTFRRMQGTVRPGRPKK
jgi:hypothetical protein